MNRFHAVNPATGAELDGAFRIATSEDVNAAASAAAAAFPRYSALSGARRAAFLRAVADEIEADSAKITERANQETALGTARLNGEVGRTCLQLRMFADIAEDGTWVDARIDRGDPDRQPTPKPDVRSMLVPLGPVAVFGASNFPLAFSVAGGDTAAALAAGCPVVVKAHPAHPGTSELVADAIRRAITTLGLPKGVFSLVFDDGHEAGIALVGHPLIKAVAFTGSLAGGDALRKIAAERPEPIPVYAEMGSVNPQFLLPNAVRKRGSEIAAGLHASFTVGVGQFCTNPGLVLLPAGPDGDALRDELAARTRETPAKAMLTAGICSAYGQGLHRLRAGGARLVAEGPEGSAGSGRATVWEADLTSFTDPALLEEVFGPSTLLLRFQDADQLRGFTDSLRGQLTASIHGQAGELGEWAWLARALRHKAGRLIVNQFPTGVEVTDAMVHGGPYPATSDGRSTSVGGRAIERFARLVAWQNFPQELLPEALRD